VIIQLALDKADAARLMACAADAIESNIEDDDKPYREPPVSVRWLESA
jgi:hypothetical protein